jgi:hypothetical protein
MKNISWQKGSFLDNFNSSVQYLGYDNIGVAFGLAKVDWPDTETRDRFLKIMTETQGGQ